MNRFLQIFVGFIILFFFFILSPDFVFADSWTATGALSPGRNSSTATVLESGKVLINGGETTVPVSWVNLYDPSTGIWSLGPNMLNSRSGHTTTLLPDGRVLVAGGKGTASYIQTAEIYNPVTNSWAFATPMNSARFLHTATLLNDGRVLVAGGFYNGSAITGVEIFDPITNTWTSVASLPVAKRDHTATLLPDGKVLIAGGSGAITETFVYNPTNDSWSSAGNLSFIRSDPAAILLNDGRVLVVGGTTVARCSAEIWSPDTNQWTIIQQPNYCREAHSAVKLADGTVFVIGGFGGLQGAAYLNSTEIYNPVTGQWTIAASMINPRAKFPSVMLKDNTVLVAGGVNYTGNVAASEIYSPNIVSVTPTPSPTPPKTPLLLIPGIGGSEFKSDQFFFSTIRECGDIVVPYIYLSNSVVWLDAVVAATSRCDDYFDVLKLNLDGQTPQFPQIVLNGTFVSLAYGAFIDFFTDNGYELNKTLFLFPYDWRKDVSLTKTLLDHKIETIKQQTGTEKVDIVTHSMGGLVARNYIADIENAQKVRKLIVLGTPHLGSVDYIKNLMYGGCLSVDPFKNPICFGVSSSEVKDVIQNMTGGFELAPSLAYFTFYSGEDNLHPFPFRDDRDIDNNDVTGPLNYFSIKSLLTNLGYNTLLFTPSEAFHTLDENLTDTNGVEVSIVAGSGINTLGQIIEKYRVNFKGIKIPQRDKITINGDETVPLLSASLSDPHKNLSLLGPAVLYYTNQKHGKLVENGPALNLVNNILDDDATLPDGVSHNPYKLKGHQLSVHSPVLLHVYDQHGNHTGETPDGDFEATIPGSSYDTLEDAKFVWLPDDGVYNIEFVATDQGSFDFKIRKFEEDLNSQTILYKDVPLTNSTKASAIFDTQSLEPPVLNLDENGDGVIDSNIGHFSILEGDANYDHTPPDISFDVNPKTIWPANNKMVDITITGAIIDENPYVTTILVDDEYDLMEPSIATYQSQINQTFQLEASRRGDDKDGRIYTIKVLSTDLAGNTSLAAFEVIVPHDQRK